MAAQELSATTATPPAVNAPWPTGSMAKTSRTPGTALVFAASKDFSFPAKTGQRDRKSTRLNSSHSQISYAVFCLKKKKKRQLRLQCDRLQLSDVLTVPLRHRHGD